MGHTGTLDPMATGLLVICLGEATKLVPYLTADSKRYEAEISLGASTNTYDADGDIIAIADQSELTALDRARCENALSAFLGEQEQRPPAFSAIKVDGERLYEKARRGEEVEVPLRQVTFHELTLRSWEGIEADSRDIEATGEAIRESNEGSSEITHEIISDASQERTVVLPRAHIEVYCSKGTYIRSLASDLGDALGVGAHLTALRRTAAGGFSLNDAHTLDSITEESLSAALIPLVDALPEAPRIELTADQVVAVRQGKTLKVTPELERKLTAQTSDQAPDQTKDQIKVIRAVSTDHEIIALLKREGDHLKVARGFTHS